MTLFVLAYLGGVLTIISPCILPVLPFVFATLLKQGLIIENDLHGLGPEKIELILGVAS